jgi:hypothetical protein
VPVTWANRNRLTEDTIRAQLDGRDRHAGDRPNHHDHGLRRPTQRPCSRRTPASAAPATTCPCPTSAPRSSADQGLGVPHRRRRHVRQPAGPRHLDQGRCGWRRGRRERERRCIGFYGVRAKTTGVGYVSCNQFSLFEGGGSTDRSLAGTAGTDFSINNGFVASNVNDSNTSTFCASANSSAAGTNGVLWIDFGSGNKFDIRKFGWRARTDASGENPLTWEVVAKQASGDAWTVLCQLPNKASWTLGEYFEQTFLSLSYASQAVSSTASNSVTPTYDGPAATFAVTSGSLPSGMSLNSSTGELTGTAGSTQSGIVITATLSDGSGVAVVSSSFTLTAAVGYRYYFLEFITTPNGFIGASTIKLLDAGSTDHALSSGGAVATTVSYTQNGSFPVTNCNDGNDTSFTTSSAGTAAASGHGILIDMGSIYDITKLGYRSRSDSFGTVEAMKTGNVKAKVYAGASYTTLHAIDETATPYGNNEYREYTL